MGQSPASPFDSNQFSKDHTADIDLDYGSRLVELAKKFGTNSDAYAQALIFAIDVDTDGAAGDQASELLARDCINNKRLEGFFNSGPHPKDAVAENLFQTIAQKSAIRAYRGQATKILADFFKDSKPDEAETLYEQVIEKYADVKSFEDSRQKLGTQAQGGLFYVQHLAVGKVAPDFRGEDVNGVAIKLSDYRNTVVVICFCSESCVPCRQLYPYWRSLEERMKGKPFALIGINPDSKTELLKAVQREHFTWPVLWDHGDADTSLNSKWYVQGWPNIFLIDAKGIIRQHWVGSPGTDVLDQQIERLVKEATANAAPEN